MSVKTELKKLAKVMTGDEASGEKITEVLRDFHKDLTGKDSNGDTISKVLSDLAENYEAPSGGGLIEKATTVAFDGAVLPEYISLVANNVGGGSMFKNTTGLKTLVCELESAHSVTGFANNSTVEEIVFLKLGQSYFGSFNTNNELKKLILPANVIKIGTVVINGDLVDESLISVANGLIQTSGTAKLTLSANSKARLSTLTGTVKDGLFTQDESGAVTLEEFITQKKGWTLA